jgi:hypothetical protein
MMHTGSLAAIESLAGNESGDLHISIKFCIVAAGARRKSSSGVGH